MEHACLQDKIKSTKPQTKIIKNTQDLVNCQTELNFEVQEVWFVRQCIVFITYWVLLYMVSKSLAYEFAFNTRLFLVILLSLGCQKSPDPKPAPEPSATPPAAQEIDSEGVNSEDLASDTSSANAADSDDTNDVLAELTVFSDTVLKRVDVVPDSVLYIEEGLYDEGDRIDCDSLENPYVKRLPDTNHDLSILDDTTTFTQSHPYFLPDEYVFDDEDSVPTDITFETLPIFKAPMTPVLCHLRNAIISEDNYAEDDIGKALDELASYDDIEVSNFDMFLVNELAFQTLVAGSVENSNVDAEQVMAKIALFLVYVEQFADNDLQQWEDKRTAAGIIAGVIGATVNIAGGRFLPKRPVFKAGSFLINRIAVGPRVTAFVSRRLSYVNKIISSTSSSSKTLPKVMTALVDLSVGGLATYYSVRWLSGLGYPKGLGILDDHNMFGVDVDPFDSDGLDEEALIEIINEGMGRR